jgi:phosphatidylglycerol:prolipoprotein diacylglycerol transferase
MLPTLQLGPLALQVPGLVLLAGLWVGLTLSERRARRKGENPGDLYNLVFIALIAGIIGARLSYAITYPSAFAANPLSLLSINPGLFDPLAGVFIGICAAAIYIYRKQLPFWSTLDALTPFFAVLAIAQGIANFAAGSAFGSPTDLPWGINLWGATRHPTQIYEILLAAIILLAAYLIDKSQLGQTSGFTFLSFIALSAAARLFSEAFRGDSTLIGNGYRSVQIISWLVLAACLALLGRRIQLARSTEKISQ